MFDEFNDEIELEIKSGMENLYWFKNDLKKAWITSGISPSFCEHLFARTNEQNKGLSKRELMDCLYEELRKTDKRNRDDISRNFVKILLERRNFVAQKPEHRIEIAKNCSLRLRQLYEQKQKEKEYWEQVRKKEQEAIEQDYHSQLLKLREKFNQINRLAGAKRGYALEDLFVDLMKISRIPVEEPFRNVGEQIDGAIKYDGHYYLIELKWQKEPINQTEIGGLRMKVDGKMESRGIFIAMNGYSQEALTSLIKGKDLVILLLDGRHLTNVICGFYTFKELLEHAIRQASLKGEVYCSHTI